MGPGSAPENTPTNNPVSQVPDLAQAASESPASALEGLRREQLGPAARIEFEVVDLKAMMQTDPARAEAVLDQYYHGFERAFPFEEQRDDKAALLKCLNDPEDPVQFRILLDKRSGAVLGGAHFNVMELEHEGRLVKEGVLQYLSVVEEHRSKGIGGELLEAVTQEMRGQGCSFISAEIEDLEKMSLAEIKTERASGVSTPDRTRFYQAHDFLIVGLIGEDGRFYEMPYGQAPLDEGMEPSLTLRWITRPLDEAGRKLVQEGLPVELAAAKINEYHASWAETGPGSYTEGLLREMRELAAAHGVQRFSFRPLSAGDAA